MDWMIAFGFLFVFFLVTRMESHTQTRDENMTRRLIEIKQQLDAVAFDLVKVRDKLETKG